MDRDVAKKPKKLSASLRDQSSYFMIAMTMIQFKVVSTTL